MQTIDDRMVSRRALTRRRGSKWCRIRIELRRAQNADGLELSVTGEYGRAIGRGTARREAFDYWRSFFEDSPEELGQLAIRFDRGFTPATAARFVLETDGEFHGLDVTGREDERGRLEIVEGGGCIHDELAKWFPEARAAIPWHLNAMRAGCTHQRAAGWGRQDDIGKPCPECGYRYGSAWLFEPLPAEVETWARTFGDEVR